MMQGDSMATAGMTLASNKIWVGNGSSVPTETLKSAVPISDWAAAGAAISMGGFRINQVADPAAGPEGEYDAANRRYVDMRVQGLKNKAACLLATNQSLPENTYAITSGPVYTLTATANGAITNILIDTGASGVTITASTTESEATRILVKDEVQSEYNGIYYIKQLGSAGTPYILVRTTDCDTNSELLGAYTLIQQGTFGNQGWSQASDTYDIDNPTSDLITWTQFSSAGSYIAGKGLILTESNTFNFASGAGYSAGCLFYGIASGGSTSDAISTKIEILAKGAERTVLQAGASAPAWSGWKLPASAENNKLLVGNGTDFVGLATANSGVLITSAGGVPSISSTLPLGVTIAGNTIYRAGVTVPLADGGTSASLTAVNGGLVWSNGSAMQITAAGPSGHFVRTNNTAAPTFYDLFGAANTWAGVNTFEGASSTTRMVFKYTLAPFNPLEITTNGKLLFGTGAAAPVVEVYSATDGTLLAKTQKLRLAPLSGATPVLELSNSLANGYAALQCGSAAVNKTWTLPQSGTGVWQADGSGVITCAALPASGVTGAALTISSGSSPLALSATGTTGSALLKDITLSIDWAAGATGIIGVAHGGTGRATLNSHGLLTGNGTGEVNMLSVGASGTVLTGTGNAPSFSATPTLTGLTTTGQAALTLDPHGLFTGDTGELRFKELAANGAHYVGFKANSVLGGNVIWTLPNVDAAGFMKSDGSGTLSLSSITGSDVTGANLSVTSDSNVLLNTTGTLAGSLLKTVSITAAWNGQLPVSRGGTGASTLTLNGLLIGNGSSAVSALSVGASGTVLVGTGSTPTFLANITLTSVTTTGQGALIVGPFGVAAGNTGELRFMELAAGGTNYVGFKAPDALSGNKIWVLPASDTAGFMKSNGSGTLSIAALAGTDITGAALTASNDTNVTLSVGGTHATALLRAASVTAGWTGTLAVGRGGLGGATSPATGGLLYGSSGTAYACSVAGSSGQILRSGAAGAPTWSGYTMPASMTGANSLFLTSASGVVGELTPTANRLLSTDGSSVVSWGSILNVARNTSGGIARKYSNKVAGDGANAYITVTHNLNTIDLVAGIRKSNASDTLPQQQAYTRIDIQDANSIRVYFNAIQPPSNYYVVTVIG